MKASSFEFGIEGLDWYYPGVLTPGSLFIIAGHPGSGKTTMAAQLCYYNAIKGSKCLYISTQETEEKFLRFTKRFNLDFEYLLASGLFKFSRLPLISSEEALDGILESITSMVLEFNPNILVIDSITPLTKVIAHDARRRALLQNYFYNIAFDIKGLVLLIAEIPLGKSTIEEAGDVEFVADGIIILRHELRNGLLHRRMEIRKLRGSPVEMSELPFTIAPSRGIVVLVPPKLEARGESEPRRTGFQCSQLDMAMGGVVDGDMILVAGPNHELPLRNVLMWILRVAREGRRKILIVTYRVNERDIRRLLEDIRLLDQNLGDLIDGVEVVHLSPAMLSPETLFSLELEYAVKQRPDLMVIVGVEALEHLYRHDPLLMERYLGVERSYLKKLNTITFKIAHVTSVNNVNWIIPYVDTVILVGDELIGLAGGNVIAYRVNDDKRLIVSRESFRRECF